MLSEHKFCLEGSLICRELIAFALKDCIKIYCKLSFPLWFSCVSHLESQLIRLEVWRYLASHYTLMTNFEPHFSIDFLTTSFKKVNCLIITFEHSVFIGLHFIRFFKLDFCWAKWCQLSPLIFVNLCTEFH